MGQIRNFKKLKSRSNQQNCLCTPSNSQKHHQFPTKNSTRLFCSSDFLVKNWTVRYTDYKPALTTKAQTQQLFLCINGEFNPKTSNANQRPNSYNSDSEVLHITGPADISLYSGTLAYKSLTKTEGSLLIDYNGSQIELTNTESSNLTPLPFSGSNYLNDTEDWL